jgi:hypothetical protein
MLRFNGSGAMMRLEAASYCWCCDLGQDTSTTALLIGASLHQHQFTAALNGAKRQA